MDDTKTDQKTDLPDDEDQSEELADDVPPLECWAC